MKLRVNFVNRPANEQVSSYDIQLTKDGSPLPIASVAQSPYELDDPPTGNYTAKVRAVNIAGAGLWSNVATGPGIPGTPPQPEIIIIA